MQATSNRMLVVEAKLSASTAVCSDYVERLGKEMLAVDVDGSVGLNRLAFSLRRMLDSGGSKAMAISPDGATIAACVARTLCIASLVDADRGIMPDVIECGNTVSVCCWDSAGSRLAFAVVLDDASTDIRVYDRDTHACRNVRRIAHVVSAIDWRLGSDDGLVVGCRCGTVRCVDLVDLVDLGDAGSQWSRSQSQSALGCVRSVRCHVSRQLVATSSKRGVCVFSISSTGDLIPWCGALPPAVDVAWSPKGLSDEALLLATASKCGKLAVWDLGTAARGRSPKCPKLERESGERITRISWSGDFLYTGQASATGDGGSASMVSSC